MVTLHELKLNADGDMTFEFEGGISSGEVMSCTANAMKETASFIL